LSASNSVTILQIILSVIAALFGAIVTILQERRQKKNQEKTSEKIGRLSNVLKKASSEIEELEDEVKKKSQRLQELNEHSKQLETLMSLKEEQVEAIRKELTATLKENSRSNRIWTILIGALWFVLGLIVRGFLRF
jgi:uncharacterized membrane protein